MSRTQYDHLHHYKAVNKNKKVYKCTVPECPHSVNASLMIGREAGCPECESKVIITAEHLRRENITCIGCGRKGFAKNFKHGASLPEGINLPSDAEGILRKLKDPHGSAVPSDKVEVTTSQNAGPR